MAATLDRQSLLASFDEIGQAAIAAGVRLGIAVFGGSALMLASNFRFSTEDVDIAEIGQPWPDWLSAVVESIARRNDWSDTWLNDAVTFHLSPAARPDRDLVAFGSFPRGGEKIGLTISVPTARYMLALKLKALRIGDPSKGRKDFDDVTHLLRVVGIADIEEAVRVLAEFFPRSAADADKQRFVLKYILASENSPDAPSYPCPGV